MDNCKTFEAMVGDGHYHSFKCLGNNEFILNDNRYEAMEDPDDGYRSYLGAVSRSFDREYHDSTAYVTLTHHEEQYESDDDSRRRSVYKLTDKDGHVWLMFGTDHTDDYYPCFIFEYQPKAPV